MKNSGLWCRRISVQQQLRRLFRYSKAKLISTYGTHWNYLGGGVLLLYILTNASKPNKRNANALFPVLSREWVSLSLHCQPSHEYFLRNFEQFLVWSPCRRNILGSDPCRCAQAQSHQIVWCHTLVGMQLWEYHRIHLMQATHRILWELVFEPGNLQPTCAFQPSWVNSRVHPRVRWENIDVDGRYGVPPPKVLPPCELTTG